MFKLTLAAAIAAPMIGAAVADLAEKPAGALAAVAAPVIVAGKADRAPVHYRATQWAQIGPGEHIAESFALVVYASSETDTLDSGLELWECDARRALLAADVANEFACVAERSL